MNFLQRCHRGWDRAWAALAASIVDEPCGHGIDDGWQYMESHSRCHRFRHRCMHTGVEEKIWRDIATQPDDYVILGDKAAELDPIWTTRATLTAIGEGRVTLGLATGGTVCLPVELPSEERLLGERLYEPVVVAVLAAGEARTAEEDLAWHRAEVARLRGLLGDIENGSVTGVRIELAPRKICITAPTEAGERAVLNAILGWCAERSLQNPEVGAKLRELTQRAERAEAFAGLLACALRAPEEGKRLGPGPCEALKAISEDQALLDRCSKSMRTLLDENEHAIAVRTFAVDAGEWGRAEVAPSPPPQPEPLAAVVVELLAAWPRCTRDQNGDGKRCGALATSLISASEGRCAEHSNQYASALMSGDVLSRLTRATEIPTGAKGDR